MEKDPDQIINQQIINQQNKDLKVKKEEEKQKQFCVTTI